MPEFFVVEFKVFFFLKKTRTPLGIKWDAPYLSGRNKDDRKVCAKYQRQSKKCEN